MRCAGNAVNLRMASGKRQFVLFAHILAQDARKGAVGAGMRMFLSQQAFGRSPLRIVVDRDPWLLQRQQHVRFVHAEDGHLGKGLVLDEDVAERVDGVFMPKRRHFREPLALQRQQVRILHDRNQNRLRPRNLLPLVVPVFAGRVLARRSACPCECAPAWPGPSGAQSSLASPPSCAHGGMKAENVLNHAV